MFYLKCQKEKNTDIFYIWADDNNLNEWCVSHVPCFFKDYTTAVTLMNMVTLHSTNLKNICIIEET